LLKHIPQAVAIFMAQISILASATLGASPAARGFLFFGFTVELPGFMLIYILMCLPRYPGERRLIVGVRTMAFLVGFGIADIAVVILVEACRRHY
jgi:hypothetical protein